MTPESSVICFDIAGNAPAASEEKFPEALAPELKLNEWVFWEHYENIGQQKDTRDQNYLAN